MSAPPEREVQTSTAIVALVLNAGVSAEELAHAADMDKSKLEQPTLVPYSRGIELWKAAERLTGDPLVGLTAGSRVRVDQLPFLSTVFAHSTHLADALDRMMKYLPVLIRDAPFEFVEGAKVSTFRYRSPSRIRHGVDAMFSAILQLARDCSDQAIAPSQVRLQSPPPADPRPYVAYFGVRPEWDAAISEMTFERQAITRPFRGASPVLLEVLESNAPVLLPAEPRPPDPLESIRRAVRDLVRRDEAPSLDRVAKQLGKSRRSLQREIGAREQTFRALRDEVLRDLADGLLGETELSLEAVSEKLGFSTRSSFERAYRRWTGTPPASARRALRQNR